MTASWTQAQILPWLAPDAASYLEVGVQEGRSLRIVLDANPALSVTLCDTWGTVSGGSGRGSHAHIEALLADYPQVRAQFVDGDSMDTLPTLEGPYDLVHIDGGHGYEVALSDLLNGWRLCGSVMVVHDISMAEVWRAFFTFVQGLPTPNVECYFGGHGTGVVYR